MVKLSLFLFAFFLPSIAIAENDYFSSSGNLEIRCDGLKASVCRYFQLGGHIVTASHCLEYYEFIKKTQCVVSDLILASKDSFVQACNYSKRVNGQDIGCINYHISEPRAFGLGEDIYKKNYSKACIQKDYEVVCSNEITEYGISSNNLVVSFNNKIFRGMSGSEVIFLSSDDSFSFRGVLSKKIDDEGFVVLVEKLTF